MLGLVPGDVQLGALPLAHSFGMSAVLNASVLAGAGVVLARRPDVAGLERLLATGEVSVVQAVPTLFARLAEAAAAPWPGVRLCVVSGAPLPEGLPARIHRRLRGRLLERYGMTEVSPLTVREVPADGGEPGDVGLPLRGVVVRVAGGGDEGELEVAAPSMFLGYDGDRRATAEVLRGGLMRTGDLGRVGDGGRVTITGRLKEVIVRGGNNVAAREVERLLESHPAVAEAAVLGMPDADLGEEVAAALVLRPRAPEDVVAELERLCGEQLALYKRPRLWYLLDSLPRTTHVPKAPQVSGRNRVVEAVPATGLTPLPGPPTPPPRWAAPFPLPSTAGSATLLSCLSAHAVRVRSGAVTDDEEAMWWQRRSSRRDASGEWRLPSAGSRG
jgi:long-chain acyl-CoA synthetase